MEEVHEQKHDHWDRGPYHHHPCGALPDARHGSADWGNNRNAPGHNAACTIHSGSFHAGSVSIIYHAQAPRSLRGACSACFQLPLKLGASAASYVALSAMM
jgi:hypothetical protein